jgi:hypothetical protein
MANDKNFKVKNALEIGGGVKSSLGTVTSSNIDLSTGNYFKDSANAVTYTISNPSPAQSFQLELTGATADIGSAFATTTYSGNGAARTITTNIDMTTDGGLVWSAWRNSQLGSAPRVMVDSVRGFNKSITSHDTAAEASANSISAFTTTGYSMPSGDGPQGGTNYSGANYVSWSFKRTPKFFDIVTYTGNGVAGRTLSHNLGSVPGMVLIKPLTTGEWSVYHRGMDSTSPEDYYAVLDSTAARVDDVTRWNDTAPTSTQITLGNHNRVNENGEPFVAYFFGHDTTSSSMIQCGQYIGNGLDTGTAVNLGWQPQWLLVKNIDVAVERWHVLDSVRGINNGSGDPNIHVDNNSQESNNPMFDVSSTGFTPRTNDNKSNGNSYKYIYVAIRSASDPAITWPATVKWPGGITPTAPGIGETDLYTFTTDDSGSSYYGYLSGDNLS